MNKDGRKIRFGLWYDFRNPPEWRQASDRLYSEILDQIAWSESHGFDDVWLSEHHFIEDGYLPSILPVAAAISARTKRIRIASGVLLMPFHNPVRLAEDIAVVDVISGGRFEFGVGVGFKLEEFDSFGVSFKERGSRTNESLDIIRRLLSGETVTYKSDFFNFKNIKVAPEPIQKPHPPIWLGGFTPAALRRAARYGDGFTVPGATHRSPMGHRDHAILLLLSTYGLRDGEITRLRLEDIDWRAEKLHIRHLSVSCLRQGFSVSDFAEMTGSIRTITKQNLHDQHQLSVLGIYTP